MRAFNLYRQLPYGALCLALFASSCSSSSRVGGESPKRLISLMAESPSLRPFELAKDEASAVGLGYPERFSRFNPHEISWIHAVMDEEAELIRIGKAAISEITNAIRTPLHSTDLRVRLVMVLGKIGEPSSASGLFDILDSSSKNWPLRDACFNAIGLLRTPEVQDRLRTYLRDAEESDDAVVRWALGMSGDEQSRAQFLKYVEVTLAAEEIEDVTLGLPIPKIEPSEQAFNLRLRAKVTPTNMELPMHIWRVAHFRESTVLQLLIEALRYHNTSVQHMAIHFLETQVEARPTKGQWHDYDLHTLDIYRSWKNWWAKNSRTIEWYEKTAQYRILK